MVHTLPRCGQTQYTLPHSVYTIILTRSSQSARARCWIKPSGSSFHIRWVSMNGIIPLSCNCRHNVYRLRIHQDRRHHLPAHVCFGLAGRFHAEIKRQLVARVGNQMKLVAESFHDIAKACRRNTPRGSLGDPGPHPNCTCHRHVPDRSNANADSWGTKKFRWLYSRVKSTTW